MLDTCKGDGNRPKALVGRALFETHVESMLYINAYFVKKDLFVYMVVFMHYCLVAVTEDIIFVKVLYLHCSVFVIGKNYF